VWKNFLTQLVREPTRQGAPLDMLLANGGLECDVVVGGHLGHRDHEIIRVFNSWRSKEGGSAELPPWTSAGQTLGCLGTWCTRVAWEAVLRGLGRLDIVQEGNRKGTRAGHSSVLKERLAGKKVGQAEQRALAGILEREFMTFGRRDRQL